MDLHIGPAVIRLVQGDITQFAVDVIVNAANSDLVGGGGVDGAIHRAAGPQLMLELNRVRPKGGCPSGGAVLTGAGALPAKFVVHAVGPIWRGGGFQEDDILAEAYETSLKLAAEKKAVRVSLPSISTGAYGFPVEKAARVAVAAAAAFLRKTTGTVKEVVFVLFDRRTLDAYEKALEAVRQST